MYCIYIQWKCYQKMLSCIHFEFMHILNKKRKRDLIFFQIFSIFLALLFFLVFHVFLLYHFSSSWITFFSFFSRRSLLTMYSLNFLLSKDVFIFPSFWKNIFSKYRILGWHIFFFNISTLKMLLFHFWILCEKYTVLKLFPQYVACQFSIVLYFFFFVFCFMSIRI